MLIYTVRCFNLCLCSSRACHRWNIDTDISTRARSRVGFSFLTLLLSFFIITQASWGCVACSDWAWKNTLYYIKDHKHNGIYININYDQNPGTCIILTDSQKVLQMIGAYWVFDVILVFFIQVLYFLKIFPAYKKFYCYWPFRAQSLNLSLRALVLPDVNL